MAFELYPFQKQDCIKIYRAGSGAIASEMGVGKTHEAIALDEAWSQRGKGPTLIVAPLNTHISWQEKYGLQAPSTDVHVIDRKDRSTFVEAIRKGRADVYIMHWEALRLMPELARIQFNTIVADEAHKAASRKSQQTQALKRLKARHRLAMSGTMSGDRAENLWSPFNWVWPTHYRSYWKFDRSYVVRETDAAGFSKITGVKNFDKLREEIDPWYVRHLKREQCCAHHPQGVLPELPDKSYEEVWVDLTPQQRRAYEQMRTQMVAWVGEHESEPLVAGQAIAQLARLCQITMAQPTIEEGGKVSMALPSSKLDAIKGIAESTTGKLLVWSASKQWVNLAARELSQRQPVHVLTGDTPQGVRNSMISNWKNDDRQIMLATIQTAGTGIDGLQEACSTAVFASRTWSTVANQQAEDRLDRPGQKNAVTIIDIRATDTVDLGQNQKLIAKWENIKAILGDRR